MKKNNVKTFFDNHSHYSAYNKNPKYYFPIIKHLSTNTNQEIRVLDVGCGDGSFLKGLISSGIKGQFLGIDLSYNLTKKAKDNNQNNKNVELIVADGFNIPIQPHIKFDLIHIDSVLHHLIGKTRYGSLKLSNRLLEILSSRLSQKGLLLVEEMYYNSRLIPFITSSLIFYSLKFINSTGLDFSKIRNDLKPGLEVNFFYDMQLRGMLGKHGKLEVIDKTPSKLSKLEKALWLKERGHISYLLKQN